LALVALAIIWKTATGRKLAGKGVPILRGSKINVGQITPRDSVSQIQWHIPEIEIKIIFK
jgi:hypothetical protein